MVCGVHCGSVRCTWSVYGAWCTLWECEVYMEFVWCMVYRVCVCVCVFGVRVVHYAHGIQSVCSQCVQCMVYRVCVVSVYSAWYTQRVYALSVCSVYRVGVVQYVHGSAHICGMYHALASLVQQQFSLFWRHKVHPHSASIPRLCCSL